MQWRIFADGCRSFNRAARADRTITASACNALYDPSVGMRSALHADLGSKVVQQLAGRTAAAASRWRQLT
jgi:hypothetical protein